MADDKVRFVRCPKCENVLPELPDYSVYRCGGCGAVLRAKMTKPEVDKPEIEISGDCENLDGFPEEGVLVDSAENLKPNDSSIRCVERGSECQDNPNNENVSKITVDDWTVLDDFDASMARDELNVVDKGTNVAEANPPVRNDSNFNGAPRSDVVKLRFSAGSNLNESSSNAPERGGCLQQDRVELLRKLDELKEQLSQSCNLIEKPNEKFPHPEPNSNGAPPPWFPDPHPFMYQYPSSNHLPLFGDPYGSRVLKRPQPPAMPCHYQPQQPPRAYFSGQCFETAFDPYLPHPTPNPISHQSSCPCAFHPQICNPRTAVPLNFHGPHVKCSSDLPHFRHVANGGHHCLPVAGGAPFITCSKCFELLQLPKQVSLMGKNRFRVQCGACSAIFNLCIANKKLFVSPHSSSIDDATNPVVKTSWAGLDFYSDDSAFEFQSVDRDRDTEHVSSLTGQGFDSGRSQGDMQGVHSSPSLSTSGDDEDFPDGLISSVTAISSPPIPGSPLEQLGSSNNRCRKGNRSARLEQEKLMSNKTASRQNSLKDLASEMEASFNSGTSQGSAEISRDQARGSKKGDSLVTGIKKTIMEISRSSQTADHGKTNITVNGRPIPKRLAKKAEKLAGPINPGDYWYDSRAGFWGVMGKPCLGIIPPFIEEFSHPMPKNCAGGDSGVFVNGRELHQKDFELLVSRGLPTDRDRSYIIEISGSILDEDSGKQLDSLGKLAPTVENAGRGFGMKSPKLA